MCAVITQQVRFTAVTRHWYHPILPIIGVLQSPIDLLFIPMISYPYVRGVFTHAHLRGTSMSVLAWSWVTEMAEEDDHLTQRFAELESRRKQLIERRESSERELSDIERELQELDEERQQRLKDISTHNSP